MSDIFDIQDPSDIQSSSNTQPDNSGIDMPDIDVSTKEAEKVIIKDETDVAIKFAFIGSGQAGCRLVTSFYKNLGYRRTMLFNTTKQDIEGLDPDPDMIYDLKLEGVNGAGKDPSKGKKAIEAVKEDVYQFMRKRIGDAVDYIIICIGAGGGTGSGTANTLINLARQYLMDLGVKNVNKRVGVIMSLPSRSEGAIVNRNAYEVAQNLCNEAKKGNLSPLLIIDNERIRKMYSNLSIKQFYPVTNNTVIQLFNIFAFMASRSSEYATFDIEDYTSVLSSGLITCGMTKIDSYKKGLDLPAMFRENIQKNLFATDIDFDTVTHAAAILAADEKSLGEIPQDVIETTFESLNSLFGNKKGLMLHRGIYGAKQEGIRMFTIIGGFDTPQNRLNQIYELGGGES